MEKDSTLVNQKLKSKDQKPWSEAVNYYKNKLVQEDLRISEYMSNFKTWIITQEQPISEVPEEFREHMKTLQNVSEIYTEYFWPEHQVACEQVLQENISMIRSTEQNYVERITKLTRQFWEFEKIRVDITYVAKSSKWNLRNRPYTSLFPTHVVMNAEGENYNKGNWVELLYHESAHHLILPTYYFVGATINDVAQANKIKIPRQLWHAYLFYFTGQISQQLLRAEGIDYPLTYMERNGVFSRYQPVFKQYLDPYMEGKTSLAEATSSILTALN